MSLKEVGFAASTIWVILAAILVIFMQAGFAFLEAGLTRMKNVGHIAAKNVLILAIASIVYYCVGFGLAFGDGGGKFVGGSGFFPTVDELLTIGQSPFSWFSAIPGGGGLPLRGRVRSRLARDRLGRHGRAYAALGLLRLRARASRSSTRSSRTGSGALTAGSSRRGMQDFAGSTVVHYQGALAGSRGRDPARAAARQVRLGREAERDPRSQHGVHDARRDHPLDRLVRLQPGLDALGRLRWRRASSPTSR